MQKPRDWRPVIGLGIALCAVAVAAADAPPLAVRLGGTGRATTCPDGGVLVANGATWICGTAGGGSATYATFAGDAGFAANAAHATTADSATTATTATSAASLSTGLSAAQIDGGTLPVVRGGTGASTLPACTSTQALRYDGTNWSATALGWTATGDNQANANAGAVRVPLTATTALTTTSTLNCCTRASVTAYRGGYLYAADGIYGDAGSVNLRIIDVTDSATDTIVGSVALSGWALALAISGRFAYVSTYGGDQFDVIDISNPKAPVVIGSTATGGLYLVSMVVAGDYVLGVNGTDGKFYSIDVSNPAAPSLVSTYSVSGGAAGNAGSLAGSGRYVYSAGGSSNTFKALDVSNAASPTSYSSGVYYQPLVLAASGRYVYAATVIVAGAAQFKVLDVSDPTTVATAASISIGSKYAYGLAVAGDYAYLASDAGLTVFDVSTPTAPTLLQTYSIGGSAATYVTIAGTRAYVSRYDGRIVTVDLRGLDVATARIGSLHVGRLDVRDDVTARSLDLRMPLPLASGGTGASDVVSARSALGLALPLAVASGGTGVTTGAVTSVSGTAPIASSGGATPAISIAQSSGTVNGYLGSADWSAFNAKQATISFPLAVASGGTGNTTGALAGDVTGTLAASSVGKLQGRTVATTAPADTQVLTWSAGAAQWAPATVGGGSPSGAASGDLSGTYPGPVVAQIQSRAVATTAPTDGQVLTWSASGSKWGPSASGGGPPTGSASGDLSGSYPGPSVAAIRARNILTTAPTDGQVLTWQAASTAWAPATPAGGAPSGSAGGDLGGTYPNPSVAKIQGKSVSTTAPTAGQVLGYDGTLWKPTATAATNSIFGTGADGATDVSGDSTLETSTGVDDTGVIVRNYSTLTIDAGKTLSAAHRAQVMILKVTGNATINGVLTMDYMGASAVVQAPPTVSATSAAGVPALFSVLAGGGAGGACASCAGTAAALGQTGGGGAGANDGTTHGAGSAGTAYSGGSGGGASSTGAATAGGANGGPGGNAGTTTFTGNVIGGGAGHGCGTNQLGSYGTQTTACTGGGGGVLYLIVGGTLTVGSSGRISADGGAAAILAADPSQGTGGRADCGGGAGGGAIVVLYTATGNSESTHTTSQVVYTNGGVVRALGGTQTTCTSSRYTPYQGGAGGNGSVVLAAVAAGQ